MPTRTNQGAEELYRGSTWYPPYNAPLDSHRGVLQSVLTLVNLGAIATASEATIYSGTSTATGTSNSLTLTGSAVSSGVATIGTTGNTGVYPQTWPLGRAVIITSTGDNSGLTFVVKGTDIYSEALTLNMAGPTGTGGTTSIKAFLTVSSVSVTASTVGLVQIGMTDKFGFNFRVGSRGQVAGIYVDGAPSPTPTISTALATTAASSATTYDVRGMFSVTTAANASRVFTVLLQPIINEPSATTALFGVAQA